MSTTEEILAAIAARSDRYRGDKGGLCIGLDFARSLSEVPRGLIESAGIPMSAWDDGLKRAAGVLAYTCPDMRPAVKSKTKVPQTEGAIADIVGVLTSTRKDRDEDVLESAGAEVDLKMPWLWMHQPAMPVGKLVSVLDQTPRRVKVHYALADTPLAKDVAVLSEFGALRHSHGFKVLEGKPFDNGLGRFHITKFHVMEGSSVSVPSNVDAEITAFSRMKLTHPVVKSLAEAKFRARPAQVTGGWDPVSVKVKAQPGQSVTVKVGEAVEPQRTATPEPGSVVKDAQPFEPTAKADQGRAWMGDAAVTRLRAWSGVLHEDPKPQDWEKYARGFALVRGDGTKLSDFALPHHDLIDGQLTVVLRGVQAAMAAVNGARANGMAFASEAEKRRTYNHLKGHYDQYEVEAPAMKAWTPEEGKAFAAEMAKVGGRGYRGFVDGSWEQIYDDLCASLPAYLVTLGMSPNCCCSIVATFDGSAIVSCWGGGEESGNYMSYRGAKMMDPAEYYRMTWAVGDDGEPSWTGAPAPVDMSVQVEDAAKQIVAEHAKAAGPEPVAVWLLSELHKGVALAPATKQLLRDALTEDVADPLEEFASDLIGV